MVSMLPAGADSSMHHSSDRVSDLELVELARQGDRPAFARLLRRHDDRMRGLAYRVLADRQAMDDVLQVAYLEAYRAVERFRSGGDFGTWLYRITYNACIDALGNAEQTPANSADAAGGPSGRAGSGRVVSASEVVRSALAALSIPQRVTVVLVDGEGFDHREAAEILGVAPGAVASRLHRARTKLRTILGEKVT